MSVRPRGQLDLLDPPLEGWWEWGAGASTVWVRAGSASEARARAEAHLRALGLLPDSPPALRESFLQMRDSALGRGRR